MYDRRGNYLGPARRRRPRGRSRVRKRKLSTRKLGLLERMFLGFVLCVLTCFVLSFIGAPL